MKLKKTFHVCDAAHPMIAKIGTKSVAAKVGTCDAEMLVGFFPPGVYRTESAPDGSLKVWRTDADQTMDAARAAPNFDPKLAAINARNREYYAAKRA